MKLSELLRKLFGVGRRGAHGVEEDRSGSSGDCAGSFDGVGDSLDAEDDVDPFDPFPDPVAIEIGDVFDLHSIPPREVRAVVEEYLLEARRRGFRAVRIIHGKGVGVQREIVRTVLARTPFVERFADAPPDAGGWGATVAFISQPERAEGE
ncbi:MAG TPA: Smr/MutS family protein [Pyrinomonadaceae bacterium]|nr:Smr/MutS family protein [Pyrinomonadaceae bacterium]